MGPLVPTITGPQLFLRLKNPWTYFLLAENLTSAFPNTHKPHDTQAEPLAEISGMLLLFSGHLAPGLPINSFIVFSVTAKVFPR
jgi:hypothetical protein